MQTLFEGQTATKHVRVPS